MGEWVSAVSPEAAAAWKGVYVRWEEVAVSRDKGKREVHYYLKRRDGVSDLAIIGKEKSLRHMSYHYAMRNSSYLSKAPLLKLKSRREVIDWLNYIVSDFEPHKSSFLSGVHYDNANLDALSFKDTQLRKLGRCTKEFLWLGTPWTCRKRRKHYPSFRRNGVKISVYDFVYVLVEEDKLLVAYLEDLYEDSKGNKMVVVRWFHKIDEVGILLPRNFNDREIFSSLCLQDLCIECIDGLATVLSPQHFEEFVNDAAHTLLEPFVCSKQFDNDDVQPFDITKLKGYWKQEILRYMYNLSSRNSHENFRLADRGHRVDGIVNDTYGITPKKRCHPSKDDEVCDSKNSMNAAVLSIQDVNPHYLNVGSHVEVLCQDSGMRGCWFRALIIKKQKNKVKVRYEDVQDAVDEVKKLEEWILASRIADPDILGIRISGRSIIRPSPQSIKGGVSWLVSVGTAVDAWLHDGWWEGFVVQNDSEDRIHVYFPGEKQESVFGHGDLRHSREWLGNGWTTLKERPDLVSNLLSETEQKLPAVVSCDVPVEICYSSLTSVDSGNKKGQELKVNFDLAKDDSLSQLRWKSSRKRRRGSGGSVRKLHRDEFDDKSNLQVIESHACERFFSTPLKVDHENCKYLGDSLFSTSVVPPSTNLVMSR
ncbi:hypothetical protein HS088_TW07G00858 [Tripterygium wilfordii]|uniref:BAH domain-containing protein n=1 Tax=Tripterygium wilfordii TaxID=458696 RepID=A0A7J7DFV8_TRIWF|nr:uncharacterized protein LOC120002371 [Tripterygium wilfordii]KAF5745275.1 hypothetical protein HS088_TW07G00858 [Tripterygium wilfordii]